MVAQVDLSGISYFLPILSYFIVAIVMFALLQKIKIFENVWVQAFLSLFVATIFVTFVGAREYIQNVIPWVAVLLVCLFFLLMIAGFAGKALDSWNKGLTIAAVIILIIVFVVSAVFVFSPVLGPYLPGGNLDQADPNVGGFLKWLYSSRIAGGFLLLIVSAVVAWFLVSVSLKK